MGTDVTLLCRAQPKTEAEQVADLVRMAEVMGVTPQRLAVLLLRALDTPTHGQATAPDR